MFHFMYWDLSFFGHARYSDLIEQFTMATKDLDPKNYIRYLQMDQKSILNTIKKLLKFKKRQCSILLPILVAVVFM